MTAPTVVTVRFVAVVAPRMRASVSLIVTFEPLAVMVPKLFPTLPSVMLPAVPVPVFVRLAIPVTVAAPD